MAIIDSRLRLVVCSLALLVGLVAAPRAAQERPAARGPQKVDLNTASREALETLPGVDAGVASQIVARRPYESVEQFKTKSGLSSGQLEKLTPLVVVQSPGAGPVDVPSPFGRAVGPVRQPQLPPGAVPISPDALSSGRGPTSGSVPFPGKTTAIPVPPGIVQSVPVPKGTVSEPYPATAAKVPAPFARVPAPLANAPAPAANAPAPAAETPVAGTPISAPQARDTRTALIYGAAAVSLTVALIVFMRRTGPTRKPPRRR